MNHRLHTLHVTIIAALLLSGAFLVLFALEGSPAGKATTGSTAYILSSSPLNCSFSVGAGYNVISMPCLTTAVPVEVITNTTDLTAMYQYVPTGDDRWKVYNPNLPSYVVSDLQLLTRRQGYVVIMNSSASVTVSGLLAFETDIPLAAGWNLLGYPSNVTRNLSASIAGIAATTTRVEAYNKSAEAFIYYPGDGLNDTIPGLGYWINSTTGATWTVRG